MAVDSGVLLLSGLQNNKKQKFRTTIYFDIPYEDEDKSINDGRIVVEKNAKFNFYRYE